MNDAISGMLSIAALILVALGDVFMLSMGVLGGILILVPWLCGACCGLVALYYSFKAEFLWVRISSWVMILLTVTAFAFGLALPPV